MTDGAFRHGLLPHALCALRDHLLLTSGEDLVIAWDETVSRELYHALRDAATFLGNRVTCMVYEPVAYRDIREYGRFAGRSIAKPLLLPRPLRGALSGCDAFVLVCSDTELLFSPDLRTILQEGRRGVFMPYLSASNARRMLMTSSQEVRAQADAIAATAARLTNGSEIHVTSQAGTDLHLALGQYPLLQRTGIVGPGELLILPPGNVAQVPNDGTVKGRLVVDRTVCADDYKRLSEPIVLDVEEGTVVSVQGGTDARQLREFLESFEDERAFHLTELGIGTNPQCKFSGVGAPAEDTHIAGTVAFAVGCDTHIGGVTPGPCHVDMTMWYPSLSVDGIPLVEGGHLVAGPLRQEV